jgi:hypothetical protein
VERDRRGGGERRGGRGKEEAGNENKDLSILPASVITKQPMVLPFPSPDQETAEWYCMEGGVTKVGRMEELSPPKGERIHRMYSNPLTRAFAVQNVENSTGGKCESEVEGRTDERGRKELESKSSGTRTRSQG